MTASPKISATAKAAFDEGKQGQALIYLPAIVLAELYYMNKKYGQPIDFAATFDRLQANAQYVFIPFTAAETLDFDAHAAAPEMHDRMIVGVARRLGAACITRDKQIVGSGLVTIVW